jgi:dTDP-4-amino-4,6-dideoxygalactose transaminase
MAESEYIPFSLPDIGEEEIAEVVAALRSGWTTTGPRTAQFEQAFCAYTGAAHALAVNSCTAGLHLALAALGTGPGDEVITTPLTFCSTAHVILHTGATPVLADIGDDLNLDPAAVRGVVTERTRGILPVHMAGLPCRMEELRAIAREHGLFLVEDAAHAVGSRYRDVPVGGGRSEAVAFSFYATKNLSTGEGGMVATPSAELAERMRRLCLHGISRDGWSRYQDQGNWYYEVTEAGYKYNLSDIMAALGLVQLRRLEAMNTRRAGIAATYDAAFASMPELELPPRRDDSRHAWHLYILRLNLARWAIGRDQFIREMRARGVGCSVHFIPVPMHPFYRPRFAGQEESWRRAAVEYPRLVSLPLFSGMTQGQVERVIAAVKDVAARFPAKVQVGAV